MLPQKKLKNRRYLLVIQLLISYQVYGHQENQDHQGQGIWKISQRQFLLREEFCYRMLQQLCQSNNQQRYFQNSGLKQNDDCNFCSKFQKIFQVPKIIFKADWLGVAIAQLPFEKPKLEVAIFKKQVLPLISLRPWFA